MKIIKGASELLPAHGTIFYKCTLEDAIAYLEDKHANIWVIYALQEDGWDAVNWSKNLYGSDVVDDTIYICDTDGKDIEIDGKSVDPEKAIDKYGVDGIEPYTVEASANVINKYITEYEIKTPDFDKLAVKMLKDGISFADMCKDANEFDDFKS